MLQIDPGEVGRNMRAVRVSKNIGRGRLAVCPPPMSILLSLRTGSCLAGTTLPAPYATRVSPALPLAVHTAVLAWLRPCCL